jgi:Transcription antiterminator
LKTVEVAPYKVGDPVKVTDGPFMDFSGFVQEVSHDKQKLKVLVSILEDKLLLNLIIFK